MLKKKRGGKKAKTAKSSCSPGLEQLIHTCTQGSNSIPSSWHFKINRKKKERERESTRSISNLISKKKISTLAGIITGIEKCTCHVHLCSAVFKDHTNLISGTHSAFDSLPTQENTRTIAIAKCDERRSTLFLRWH